ncbi:50S ribosomal protein L4 [Mageeibacillus indolicus]|jgi:hypothetical protein|uniref:Large ribosomal subunit protein uL4 n=2 Tax=Mageeibacillus indolicus TaxID=884684 RepID=D3QZA0_MAGIU|nr:50S ribosomal protein L4 [Mageeibacillus indolicus]ADC90433.1 50S ribosomal protein L4 [Mageeibacillus indolicus UPII9-5]KFA57236.1 50S ribosomal protein L4 [Mageeibacillus indolicus 0009-5]PNH18307.1 50S ribosomal protein L4 [Mageeibacillus indolicus]
MAKVDVYNLDGAVIGQIELSDAVFGIEPNQSVMHQVVKNQLANRRQGTGSTKTRSEVSGGGKRPWRQKGTGRARHGSTRSAQYVGGGIIFGPKPRDYHYTVSKKVRRLAIKSALSTKLQEKQLIVVENFELAEAKTKNFVTALKKLNVTDRVLVVENEKNVNLELAARNIAKVQLSRANTINVFDLLKNEVLLISKAAVEKIQEVYA